MRVLIFIVLLVLIMVLVGWVSLSRTGDKTSINIETQEIKEDTDKMFQSGATMLDEAKGSLERAADKDDAIDKDDIENGDVDRDLKDSPNEVSREEDPATAADLPVSAELQEELSASAVSDR